MKVYYEQDVDFVLIQGKKVGVVGYGSQGYVYVLNLKDNGVDVWIGLQLMFGLKLKVEVEGLIVMSLSEIM